MQRLCKSNAMKLAPIAEMPPILRKDTLFPSHRQTSYMILTQTIRKLIYLFALIPNIIIKSPLYCSYICQKIRFLIENTKKIAENLKVISKLRNAPSTLSLWFPIPHNHFLASLLPAGSSCTTNWLGEERGTFLPTLSSMTADMPQASKQRTGKQIYHLQPHSL